MEHLITHYYTYYLAIALSLLVLYCLAGATPQPRGHSLQLLGLAVLGLLAVLPVAWPYVQLGLGHGGFRRSLGECALYSADVLDYFKTNRLSAAASLLRLPTAAQSYWPGAVTVLLAAFGSLATLSRSRLRPDQRLSARRERTFGFFSAVPGAVQR